MRDVVFLLVVGGFFAAVTAYVRACAGMVDEPATRGVGAGPTDDASEAAA